MKKSINESKNRLKKLAGLINEAKDIDLSSLPDDVKKYNENANLIVPKCGEIQEKILKIGISNRDLLKEFVSELEKYKASIMPYYTKYNQIVKSNEGEFNIDDNTFNMLEDVVYYKINLLVNSIDNLIELSNTLHSRLDDFVEEEFDEYHKKYSFFGKKIDNYEVDENSI